MQKKQIFQLVLLAVGAVLAAVIGFWLVPVSNYIKARTAPLDETILEAESSTREVVTISDTELSRLISGELTLDALADLARASSPWSPPAPRQVPPRAVARPIAPLRTRLPLLPLQRAKLLRTLLPVRHRPMQKRPGPDAVAVLPAAPITSGAMPASREAGYEGEVKALVQQLYAVKGRAEGRPECLHCFRQGRV